MSKLSDQLRIHEGVRSHFYRCTSGLATIGVGRCIEEGSLGLSDDEIDYLLENDIKRCRKELERNFDWFPELDDVRQDAIINLCFNLGITRLKGFKNAIECMNVHAYEAAADHFLDSRWATQVGQRSLDVADMIRYGEYP